VIEVGDPAAVKTALYQAHNHQVPPLHHFVPTVMGRCIPTS
jgi:hypothetical protein